MSGAAGSEWLDLCSAMICYKDMTFCPFWSDCSNAANCHRALTDDVREAAARWWPGDDAPIAQFVEKPGCHTEIENAE